MSTDDTENKESYNKLNLESAPDFELPSFVNKGAVENLQENRAKVMQKIGDILSNKKIKGSAKPLVFSFYSPKSERAHQIGDKWTDSDGYEWEQMDGYKIRLPRISAEDIGDYKMPFACPRCHEPLDHPLDKKMWWIHKLCFDCVQDFETELRVQGKYKEYERQKIMANIRAFYADVTNGLEDYINSFTATYVNGEGEVERWDKPDTEYLRSMINHDLDLLKKSFEENFGEPLIK